MKIMIWIACIFLFVSKFSVAQITFQKTYGGTVTDHSYACYPTNDGGYIIAGETFGFGTGLAEFYLIKTDSAGNTTWMNTFGGVDNDALRSMQPTSDGGYIMAGFTDGFGVGSRDVLLIKTDDTGNAIWSKTYGGVGYEYANSVKETSDGGFIIAGYTVSFGPPIGNVYLIRTDLNGDSVWVRTFSSNNNYEIFSVEQTFDGGYLLCGSINNFTANSSNICIIKCDSTGMVTWSGSYGGLDNENGYYAVPTSDGGIIIVGGTTGFGAGMNDVLVIKTDAAGTMLWSKTYGGFENDQGQHIQQTYDGGYIISGFTFSYGAGLSDALLIKTDSSGNISWTKTFGGADYNYGKFIKQCYDSGYIFCGLTGSLGTSDDIYLVKTDPNGSSGCNESSPTLTVTIPAIQDSVFIPDIYTGSIVTAPVLGSGIGGTETTICTSVGLPEPARMEGTTLFPNPFIDEIKIKFLKSGLQIGVSVQNTLGETVFCIIKSRVAINDTIELDLNFLSKGIYFLMVNIDGERTVKKIVKE